ncbi:MAG: ribulose-phosphate 3-epimerase [Bacteroidota bacterium]
MSHLLAPSLLAADFLHLGKDIELVNNSSADWFHCDIMDGGFVPNISFGMPVLQAIHQAAKKPLDVHLMIEDPDRYLETFAQLGSANLTVHLEGIDHADRTLSEIRKLGMKPGLALNPGTSLAGLEYLLPACFQVILMSVNPGFGGQSFIPYTLDKIRALKTMIDKQGAQTLISIDGGVGLSNATEILEAGADILIAGSSVFRADDPQEAILQLKQPR